MPILPLEIEHDYPLTNTNDSICKGPTTEHRLYLKN